MTFIQGGFVDEANRLGQGAVGSPQLADGAVTRPKLARSAVGSGQHGTLSLTKAVGTLSSASIGSLFMSYGSAGTHAGRVARYGFGSFSRLAGSLPASGIARGTLAVARHQLLPNLVGTLGATKYAGSQPVAHSASKITSGTLGLARHDLLPNLVGTLGATKYSGSQPIAHAASKVTSGTLALARHQLLPNLVGTLGATKYAGSQPIAFNVATKATSGTLGLARHDLLPNLVGTLGATKYAGSQPVAHATTKITSGTLAVARHQLLSNLVGTLGATKYAGSQPVAHAASKITSGTLALARHDLLPNLVGTLGATKYAGSQPIAHAASKITSGTLALARHQLLPNLVGTLGATKYAGSQPIAHSTSKLTSGTLGVARTPEFVMRSLRLGTQNFGSFRAVGTKTTPRGLAFSARGDLWHGDGSRGYVYRIGTLGFRSGTNSRIGTTQIGSFAMADPAITGLDFDGRGELWVGGITAFYLTRIGTLALRGGTNSRQGTTRIGSFMSPSTGPRGVAFARGGQLWHSDSAANYVYRLGTLALRGGTNSRQGTTRVGSFSVPANRTGIKFDSYGQLWELQQSGQYLVRLGTSVLRAGTNSRQGTYPFGSFNTPSSAAEDLDFDAAGALWLSDSAVAQRRVFNYGTPDGLRRRLTRLMLAPRGVPRYVSVVVRTNPTVTNLAGVALAQRGIGTIAVQDSPTSGPNLRQTVAGWVLPGMGSYVLRDIGGTPSSMLVWNESGAR